MQAFILGEPNKESGLTTEDITTAIKCACYNITSVTGVLNGKIANEDKALFDKIKKARHYYTVYKENEHMKEQVIAFNSKSFEILGIVKSNETYNKLLEEVYESFLKRLKTTYEEFKQEFSKYYIVQYKTIDLLDEHKKILGSVKKDTTGQGEFIIYVPEDSTDIFKFILRSISDKEVAINEDQNRLCNQ